MKILLFDVDGTLIHAGGAGRRALDRALHTLHKMPEGSKGVVLAGKTDLVNFRESLQKVLGRRPSKAEVAALEVEYLRVLPAEVRRSVREKKYVVIPGVKRLLQRLRGRGDVRIGLGTGNVESGARIKLGPSGLNYHFDFGGFGSDARERAVVLKTALRRALKSVPPAQRKALDPRRDVFVIGDTTRDVAAGRKNGFRTVAVATGWDTPEDLRQAKPDHLIRDFRDVRQFLGWVED